VLEDWQVVNRSEKLVLLEAPDGWGG